jgi:hypothetical protein
MNQIKIAKKKLKIGKRFHKLIFFQIFDLNIEKCDCQNMDNQ